MNDEFSRNLSHNYYTVSEFRDVIRSVLAEWVYKITVQPDGRRRKTELLNIPCAFDIETSSFTDTDGSKTGIMYEWTFGVFGHVVVGRTWEEFSDLFRFLHEFFGTDEKRRVIVYVHSLAYEFQFIRKRFRWLNVFALDNRKPVYALTDTGIEFRCSYILSGYSLSTVGKNLLTYKVQKLVGDLDYSLIRHSGTPMTETEIGYCVNDVRVVMAYVQEKIETDGSIAKIQLTKTGYVRKFCRESCFHTAEKSFHRLRYMDIMRGLTLDPDEYKQLRRAFAGGFTHASSFFSGKTVRDVYSYDFTSSYPAVMVSEQFPMSRAETVRISNMDEFRKNLKYYCCLFDVVFIGLESKQTVEHYISESKCWEKRNAVVDNGRIVSADLVKLTVTEQDFVIIEKLYTWRHIGIGPFRRYRRGYLPRDLILAILDLYGKKTSLKGVEGMEAEYLSGKENVNSAYGMIVMAVIRELFGYSDGEWKAAELPDAQEAINKYNESKNRFLFYPWGVWVTAYARRNLFTGILNLAEDYIYSDTDSVKFRNVERHEDYFRRYNDFIIRKTDRMCRTLGIDPGLTRPKTVKGVEKPLGVWDRDAHYTRFKTLGAKRYLVEYAVDDWNGESDRGRVNMTVAGLNKQTCVPMLLSTGDPFGAFSDGLHVPANCTGKMTHTYIDDRRTGVVIDYTGTPGQYDELSSVHMEPAEYNLSLSQEYADFIMSVRETENGAG